MKTLRILITLLLVAAPTWAAQPAVGSTNNQASSSSDTTIQLTNVDDGDAIWVIVMFPNTTARTFTVTDDVGGGGVNSYTSVVSLDCGAADSGRCVAIFGDDSVTGAATVTITVDQSGSHQAYFIAAIEWNCAGTCTRGATGSSVNGARTVGHISASAGNIDTNTNTSLAQACDFSANPGTISNMNANYTGIADGSTLVRATHNAAVATAFTDENATFDSSNSVASDCVIAAIEDVAGGGGGHTLPANTLQLLGAGK